MRVPLSKNPGSLRAEPNELTEQPAMCPCRFRGIRVSAIDLSARMELSAVWEVLTAMIDDPGPELRDSYLHTLLR